MEPDFSKAPPPRPESYFAASDEAAARTQALFAEAVAHHQAGNVAEARVRYADILAAAPRFFDALYLAAAAALQVGDAAEAAALGARALEIHPQHAEALCNQGMALHELKQKDAALACYDAALALRPDQPMFHSNRAVTLAELDRHAESLAACDRALAIAPDFTDAHVNRGIALMKLGRPQEALPAFDAALRFDPALAEVHNHRALALAELKQSEAAAAAYDLAFALNPDIPFLCGARLHQKMLICAWNAFDVDLVDLCDRIRRGHQATVSFPLLALIDDPALHRQAAAVWGAARAKSVSGPLPYHTANEKIRVGYFSMDFRDHPVASLSAGLFEAHDRTAFEITGFSYGVDTGDAMRKRLEGAFDRFIDVRTKSDAEIAALARELELDIAVDLAGYTGNGRNGIFAARAAPVQINYLGYPGTMAVPYMDYLIADPVVIPAHTRAHYTEKLVYLPCYQANDDKRRIDDRMPTRAELGLPQDAFVFCSFNNPYKITPQTFASWMRILKQTSNGVLWLLVNDAVTERNLRRAAGAQADRLIFAKPVKPASAHFARQRVADLFLDTLPYNAHTTASDALWSGLPVLTLRGEAMAGRVAASLLESLDMPELVTTTREAYEAVAIDLAGNAARLAQVKAKLAANVAAKPLFKTALFARGIEEAYRQVIARHRAGLPPDDITIDAP